MRSCEDSQKRLPGKKGSLAWDQLGILDRDKGITPARSRVWGNTEQRCSLPPARTGSLMTCSLTGSNRAGGSSVDRTPSVDLRI